MEFYTKKVMEHFRNPKNMGEIKDADAQALVGNPLCGDMMRVYIKVGEKKGKKIIKDIKFKTFGCVAAIATSSVTTEIAKGKTLEEAAKITNVKVAKKLGGLPPIKMHCSDLAASGLHEAIYQYKKSKGMKISSDLERKHKLAQATLKETEKVQQKFGIKVKNF